ncbi:MAG TPA: oligopeptidase B, partial [Solibacterales bacterium]|nr:oligopeptidase B [Bryobacterales bacterium]
MRSALLVCLTMSLTAETIAPPIAARRPKTLEMHGETRIDPYFWLREKTNPEVIKYLEDENRYTESIMAGTGALQQKLYEEIRGRVKEDDLSVPVKVDGYYYYSRTEKGKQYSIYCRKKGSLDAAEQVMLDANLLAAGRKYFRIGVFKVSPDQTLLAYSTDHEGDEVYTLRFRDLGTGADLAETVPGTYDSVQWASDNRTLFYNVVEPATKRPYRLFRHVLGSDAKNDTLIYEEKDEAYTLELDKTKSREYLLMELASATTREVRYLRASDPQGSFALVEPRRKEIEYDVTHHRDSFYIRVNDTGRNFRLVQAPVQNPGRARWREVQAHRDGVLLEGVDA